MNIKCILVRDDGSQEEVPIFILIKCSTQPGRGGCMTECISSIDDHLYRSQLLGDHSRWEIEKLDNLSETPRACL